MFTLPKAAQPLVRAFSAAFTRPTFQRVVVLILGAILSPRHRTVTGMLHAAGPLAKGHWSGFHRVLCRARRPHRPLEHRGDVPGSPRSFGFCHTAELVDQERPADGAVPVGIVQLGIVQRREPDLPSTRPRTRCATRIVRVVRQGGTDFWRRHGVRASFVPGGGFSTVAQTYGCCKTIKAVEDHAAGSFEPCRMMPYKRQKSS